MGYRSWDLFYLLRGITGTACSHGDPYGGEPTFYEACEKHHVQAAYDIVRQWLLSVEVKEVLNPDVEHSDWVVDVNDLLPRVE